MFNLPWYAWLNVLALPCLWAYLMLDCALQGKPRWFRQLTTVALGACVCSLFLYWNPPINDWLTPLQIGLMVLIAPMVVWFVGNSCLQLLACALPAPGRDADKEAVSSKSPPTAPAYHLDDDDIDLDAGTSNDISDEQLGKTIAALFSRDATLDDSLGNVMRLIGAEENVNTTGELLRLQLLQALCMGLILIPPLVLGLRLIQ